MAEMTLQEAIDHAREVENGLHPNIDGCSECAKQHGQLADWLEELQEFRRVGATPADVVPWSFLERYADWFCALVQYPEFIREAKQFYLDSIGAMEGGGIDG